MPGIGLLGWGASAVGDVARDPTDRSLRRDFIAGYGVSAMVMWCTRCRSCRGPDPVGVAVAPDAVVASTTVTPSPSSRSCRRLYGAVNVEGSYGSYSGAGSSRNPTP